MAAKKRPMHMPKEIKERHKHIVYPDDKGCTAQIKTKQLSAAKFFAYSKFKTKQEAVDAAIKWRDGVLNGTIKPERKRRPPAASKRTSVAPRKTPKPPAKRKDLASKIDLPLPVPPDLDHNDWIGLTKAIMVAMDATELKRKDYTQVVAAAATLYQVLAHVGNLSDRPGYHAFAMVGGMCMEEIVAMHDA